MNLHKIKQRQARLLVFLSIVLSHEYSGLSLECKQVLRILERSGKSIVESEVNWKRLTDFQLLIKLADNSFVLNAS